MNRKGMSLAVLVITIVVMLILVSTVIMNITDYNSVEKADEATFKNDIIILQDELNTYIIEKQNELAVGWDAVSFNCDKNSPDLLKDAMPSITDYYKEFIKVKKGKLYIVKSEIDNSLKSSYVEWAKELDIGVEE